MSSALGTGREGDLRQRLCSAAGRLAERGLIVAGEGNLSHRLPGTSGGWLLSPSGCRKGELRPRDWLRIDPRGRPLSAGRPSSELAMHLAVYRAWPEAVAAIHAHPPLATAFACTQVGLGAPLLAEVHQLLGGSIPLAPFAAPGSEELALVLRPLLLARRPAILLANHGVLCISERSIEEACDRMELVEQVAKITLAARQIGSVNELSDSQIKSIRPLA
jgi:L-fuculose-phosphate aldolase